MNGTEILDRNNNKRYRIQSSSAPNLDSFESYMEIPKEKGIGTVQNIRLLNGINATILNATYLDSVSDKLECDNASFGIGFCLSGRTTAKIASLKDDLIIRQGESVIYYIPDKSGLYTVEAGMHSQRLFIEIKPETFLLFMEEWKDMLPMKLFKAMEGTRPEYHRYCDTITPAMQIILKQLYNCPYHGLTRRFFLEGKIMELIACKLNQLKPLKYQSGKLASPKADDIERIRYATEILTTDLQNPPSIMDLAKTVGLSRTKLYYDFYRIHGEPPSNFLRRKRLENAGALLKEGKYNVTEVAYSVGYSSLSHFTVAFRQYYGIVPSRYQQIRYNKN